MSKLRMWSAIAVACFLVQARAQNSVPQVVLAGTFQQTLGGKAWDPMDSITQMSPLKSGLYQLTVPLPKGTYEYKVTIGGSWTENYGLNSQQNGPNIPLNLSAERTWVKFVWNPKTHQILDSINQPAEVAPPKQVVLPGSFQKVLGDREWNPSSEVGRMFDIGDGLYEWMASFPKGAYEYKVAIGGSWTENYGLNSQKNGPNIPLPIGTDGTIVRFLYNDQTKEVQDSVRFPNILTVSEVPRRYQNAKPVAGDLKIAQVHALDRHTLALPKDWIILGAEYRLHFSPDAQLALKPDGISGGSSIDLATETTEPTAALKNQFPHLANFMVLKLPENTDWNTVLKSQMAVSVVKDGVLLKASGIQIPGILDDLYATDERLGTVWNENTPTLRLWAPTAKSVRLHLFGDETGPEESVLPLTETRGVWSISGNPTWKNKYYTYEVEVFSPTTLKIEHNQVTDPYAVALSGQSSRVRIIDLNDADQKPIGWDALVKPKLNASDLSIYELHLRDFSVSDNRVPKALQGTYLAFTEPNSYGMSHLKQLAQSGLKAVHLLPLFDISSIPENRANWKEADPQKLAQMPAASEAQQAEVAKFAQTDGYNWGYDPLHFSVPEGSYAVNPQRRTWEFRNMVQALNATGLRVILDVVYNHTSAAGQAQNSILDKVVPGYYHRLNLDGGLESSTCCANTASEHAMMRKLMVDSVVTWAKFYKIDGFRFDLMGHHMLSDIQAVRNALDALTLEKDGVDGSGIYLYGEGWNFGEVADNARGKQASQLNLYGTGIGSFSDRLRDAVRGGSPFDEDPRQNPGYATGLYFNRDSQNPLDAKKIQAWVELGLAGNLRDYLLTDAQGNTRLGKDIDYNGQPAGYASVPSETITYVAAHDNETLWDTIQMKASSETSDQRVRMNNLALSIVALGQGIPFFNAGDDLLRSKSLDRDSYNSGDWFNRLDFSYQSNNWGVGLPPAEKNQSRWPWMKTLLENPKLQVTSTQIAHARNHLQEMLAIRYSSPLFRLRSAEEVQRTLHFENTSVPGLIVMHLEDPKGNSGPYKKITVVFNPNRDWVSWNSPQLQGNWTLHPILQKSQDEAVRKASIHSGEVAIPGLTTAVFVETD
ncbi:MAG: pullulanase-type alpha-1,6-glucosidase [Deinococcaceae bacterium]